MMAPTPARAGSVPKAGAQSPSRREAQKASATAVGKDGAGQMRPRLARGPGQRLHAVPERHRHQVVVGGMEVDDVDPAPRSRPSCGANSPAAAPSSISR